MGAFGPPFLCGVPVNKYVTKEPVTFKAGRFLLTPEQLRRRAHVVRIVDGFAEPIRELSFKAGEIVETDLDIPKGLHNKLAPLTDAPAEVAFSVQEPVEAPAAKGKRGR